VALVGCAVLFHGLKLAGVVAIGDALGLGVTPSELRRCHLFHPRGTFAVGRWSGVELVLKAII